MATIVWTATAKTMRRKLYRNGIVEFGVITAENTEKTIAGITDDLSRWPSTGFPEPLLKGATHLYRARHINKRFKLIYRYDESKDIVYIEDIWDSRRSPENLTRRMKK